MKALALLVSLALGDIVLKDEGAPLGPINTLDCRGAGITCARVGSTGLVIVDGGSSGGGSSYTFASPLYFDGGTVGCPKCVVDAGHNAGTFVATWGHSGLSTYDSDVATVPAPWVASSSAILFSPKCQAVIDNTADTCLVSDIACSVRAISAGSNFTAVCVSPTNAYGSYTISYTGLP